jgi:hypothetical protein
MHGVVRGKLKLSSAAKSEVSKQMKAIQKQGRVPREKSEVPASLEPYEIEQEILPGTGKIFVSGTTVHGIETCFKEELVPGGFLIVEIGETTEKRKVILVLSDKSACINEPFPQEINCGFNRQGAPMRVDPKKELEEALEKKRKLEDTTQVYDVRVKRGPWTYKVDSVVSEREKTREELLDIRTRRVRDKHCWM